MTRHSRTAVLAALFALCTVVCAEARLDPVRVFHPGSGSFLTLSVSPRAESPVVASLFNESIDALALLPPAEMPTMPAVAFAGSGTVSLTLPQIRATFTPSLSAPSPDLTASVAAVGVASPSIPQRTAFVAAPSVTLPQIEAPHFGAYTPYAPALTGEAGGGLMPAHLGRVRFQTAFAAMQKCGTADTGSACAQGLTAGTAFDVRAGSRSLNVRLESGVSHISQDAAGVYSYVPLDPDAQAGLTYPGVSDVFGQNVNAQVAVPITRRITVGLQFDRTHYQGNSYQNDLPGFTGMRDTYLGNLTYQLPGSSAITLTARQYRYQDLLMPALTSTQTRADLNFTVKF